jgi:pSer/pThr/pTyr-binding forkhead associated (FHA) protein/Flp pilus assembly protein TadD
VKLIVLKNNVPLHEVSVDTADFDEMYEIYVGRSEDCHVQIDDPLISRHHFVLKNQNSSWYCEKLSQLGVITLNGSVVSKNPVANGDEVKCGAYSVIVADLPSLQQVRQPEPAYATAAPSYSAPMEDDLYKTQIIAPPRPEPKQAKATIPEPEPEITEEMVTEELSSESGESVEDLDSMNNLDSLDDSVVSNDFSDNTESSSSDSNEFAGEIATSSEFGDVTEADGGGDGNFEVATTDESNESTRFFKAFVNYQLVLFGEHAPYDRFQIDQDEIFIGRDPKKCQIILDDPEVSSVHAVIRKKLTEIVLEDLNSSNGTILNAERINRAVIATGDEFVIGSTSFTLEVKSDLLDAEEDRLMPVESGQTIETEEIEEEEIIGDASDINFDSDGVPEKSLIKRFKKDPAFRKKVIYVVAGLGLAYVLLGDSEDTSKPTKPAVAKEAPKKVDPNAKAKKQLSKDLENRRNIAYELGVSFFEQNKYFEALREFQTVADIDPEYKKIQSYLEQTKVGLKRLEELEAQKRAEEERIKTKKLIEELLVKAREAVKERQIPVAESFFNQIIEKDPENIEVSQLKLELETWQKEEERKALEKAARETARKRMVDSLSPGKTYYLKKEWYRAILKLEEFLRIKGMDEDLVKDASEMLSDSKNQLASDLGPLLGKARSLKEGQDLKSAYEAFLEVLKIEPTNAEALNEVDDIKSSLDARSKKIYREAIIAESLSLFADAKEKFQEVQQISPTDSDYYKKASEKLRNYLE